MAIPWSCRKTRIYPERYSTTIVSGHSPMLNGKSTVFADSIPVMNKMMPFFFFLKERGLLHYCLLHLTFKQDISGEAPDLTGKNVMYSYLPPCQNQIMSNAYSFSFKKYFILYTPCIQTRQSKPFYKGTKSVIFHWQRNFIRFQTHFSQHHFMVELKS